MPTYQYRCTECTKELEVVQKFTDAALTTCPTCAGQLRKVFSPVGVVFKGSGFYATDNRTKGARSAAASKSETPHKSEGSSSSDTGAAAAKSGSGSESKASKKDVNAA